MARQAVAMPGVKRVPRVEDRPRKQYRLAELIPQHVNSEEAVIVLRSFDDSDRAILNVNQFTALLHLRQLAKKNGHIPLVQIQNQLFRKAHAINGLTLNSLFARRLIWYEFERDNAYLMVDQKLHH